jgi:hypothetical protein
MVTMRPLLACAAMMAGVCAGADVRTAASLEDGYRQMYDLRFEEAHRTFREWQSINQASPLGPASDAAAYLFSEFDRLHILQSEFFADDDNFTRARKLVPDQQLKREFENALDRARGLEGSANADALFAEVLIHGLHSDYLGLIEKRNLAALSETKLARASAERLLAAQPGYYDAYVAIGVENYLLSLKPAPIRWLLRVGGAETDRQTGIDELRLAAEKGHYLLPFARLLLAVAALRDKDRAHARESLNWLAAQFPNNHLFREELAKVQ